MWYAWHIRCGDQNQDVPVYPVTAGGDAADGRRVQASDFLYFQFNDVGGKNPFAPGIN